MDDNYNDIEEFETPEEVDEGFDDSEEDYQPSDEDTSSAGGNNYSSIPDFTRGQSEQSTVEQEVIEGGSGNPGGETTGGTTTETTETEQGGKTSKTSATEKAAKAEKTVATAEKGASTAAKGVSAAAKVGSTGVKAVGQGVEAGANAAAAGLNAIPGVGTALGAGAKALGTGFNKAADLTSKALDQTSKSADNASKKLKENSNKHASNANKLERLASEKDKDKDKDKKSSDDKNKDKKTSTTDGAKPKQVGQNHTISNALSTLSKLKDKEALDVAKDAIKDFIKDKTKKIKLYAALIAAAILLLIAVLAFLLEPLSEAINVMKSGANEVEKIRNFMYGLGFQDSISAFNDELEFLELHYDGELNEPLLMSTLFYDDVLVKGKTVDLETALLENLGEDDDTANQLFSEIYLIANEVTSEGYSETGKTDHFVYSANKIFRLKKLAKAMMSKDEGEEETVSLAEYIGTNAELLSADSRNILQSSFAMLFIPILEFLDLQTWIADSDLGQWIIDNPMVAWMFGIAPPYTVFLETVDNAYNNQYITKYMTADAISNYVENLKYYIYDFFTAFTDITGIQLVIRSGEASLTLDTNDIIKILKLFCDGITSGNLENLIDAGNAIIEGFVDKATEIVNFIANFDITDVHFDVNITYNKFSLDIEQYEEYLRTEYIPNMPEFKSVLRYEGEDNHPTEASVNAVIKEIESIATAWEEIYGDGNESAYGDNVCIGTIKPNLIKQLNLPIPLEEYTEINFSTRTAFGVDYAGKQHNGLELNEESVGVTAGSPVYSVFDGTVVASTASNDYPDDDKSGTGGWVKIEHNVTYLDDETSNEVTSNIYSVYGGLDPSNVPATGTTVTKGQQIGTIGAAIYSEDGLTPGLHFGIYDVSKNTYLNPINMFITCSTSNSGGICTYDDRGNVVIVFPSGVLEKPQVNYDIECYSAEYGYGCKNNVLSWGSNQAIIWKQWVAAGARYKNGIAVTKVDNVDRYHVAVTSKMGVVGDLIDAKLENGEVIHMIIGDIKSYEHTNPINSKQCNIAEINDPGCYGHYKENSRLGVLEFQVDPEQYRNNPNGGSPAGWGQEWDTSQKVVSITNVGSTLNNSSSPGQICPNKPDESDGDGPNGETADNPSEILSEPLEDFLRSKGSSVEEFDFEVTKAKNMVHGHCNRSGVVAVATKTLNFMAGKGKRLPYFWSGHPGKGVQSNWGSSSCRYVLEHDDGTQTVYNACGMDCSGFVRWALLTADFKIKNGDFIVSSSTKTENWSNTYLPGSYSEPLANTRQFKAGDLLFSNGHISLIVKVNENGYTLAEAMGKSYGILYTTVSFNGSGRYTHGMHMDGFYSDPENCNN